MALFIVFLFPDPISFVVFDVVKFRYLRKIIYYIQDDLFGLLMSFRLDRNLENQTEEK